MENSEMNKTEKKVLTREDLLKKDNLEVVEVDLGDNVVVFVRQMTGHERDAFEQSLLTKKRDNKGNVVAIEQATEDFRAKLAVQTVCDENGNLLLKRDDYLRLSMNISAAKLEKIINIAQSINGIGDKDREELVKNSEADLVGNSSSNSVSE
jgi:hypothetical protein